MCLTECGCEFEGECMLVLPVPGDLTPIYVALFQSRTAQGLWPWGSAKGVRLLWCGCSILHEPDALHCKLTAHTQAAR